jgi:quercetin dioxygenase-like cupin family protein
MTTNTRFARATWTALVAGLVVLGTMAVLALGAGPTDAGSEPDPISPRMLTDRHEFTDDVAAQLRIKPDRRPREVMNLRDASNLAVVEITVQPGARFPWHTHPGPVLVAVTAGELIYVYGDDCVERPYPEGKAFVDPGGDNVHTAFNPSEDDETVVIATFLDAPDEGDLTVPVEQATQEELDQRCGMEAGSPPHDH